jgi:hypothetical protein
MTKYYLSSKKVRIPEFELEFEIDNNQIVKPNMDHLDRALIEIADQLLNHISMKHHIDVVF